jgi:hypothetical protein
MHPYVPTPAVDRLVLKAPAYAYELWEFRR